MSSARAYDTDFSDTYAAQPPPAHHVHRQSEPLPSAAARESTGSSEPGDDSTVIAGEQHAASDRPLGVKETTEGGVAVEGREGLPEGKAKLTDKLIGKTQKVAGKAMHNPEMHERGELREAGGKAATVGEARAPHD